MTTTKVLITGRGFEVTPSIRNSVHERVDKLRKYVDDIIEVHAFLTVEKYRHRSEVTVHTRRHKLASTAISTDMYNSVSGVFTKLETQAKRLKEKRTVAKRKRGERRVTPVEPLPTIEGLPAMRIVRVNNFDLKPMSVEDAALRMEMDKSGFLVFRSISTDRIAVVYKRKDGNVGLIEPEI